MEAHREVIVLSIHSLSPEKKNKKKTHTCNTVSNPVLACNQRIHIIRAETILADKDVVNIDHDVAGEGNDELSVGKPLNSVDEH